MEELFNYTYDLMMAEIDHCSATERSESKQSECCYAVAIKYWLKVKEIWIEKLDHSDMEEINFFRIIKPRFTSYLEFYLLLNRGLLFMPNERLEPDESVKYWEAERNSVERFVARHEQFLRYYKSNCRHNDKEYFLQRNNRHVLLHKEKIYQDKDCRSSHDWIIRAYLAQTMYHDWVTKRLAILQHG